MVFVLVSRSRKVVPDELVTLMLWDVGVGLQISFCGS